MNWAVIMAGGSGTRFWPESRKHRAKQFLSLFGRKTLLEQTFDRVKKIIPSSRILVFTALDKAASTAKLLHIPRPQVIGEPTGRNTAPCAAWAASLILKKDPSAVLGVFPADHFIKDEAAFCLTYGDGVSDVNITELIAFHKAQNVKATLTATVPPGRFGALEITDHLVTTFKEKPRGDGGLINGGFFVLSPDVLNLIDDDQTIWERGPLETLAEAGELAAYEHPGFWQPMDTLRDKMFLDQLWDSGKAPWKVWA